MPSIDLADARIGVAFSGGGHRAAAFGAGVLTALLDVGLMSQVRVMTSTSGGSLVNAAVACGRISALANGSPESDEVRRQVSGIVRMIQKTGINPYRFRIAFAIFIIAISLSIVVVVKLHRSALISCLAFIVILAAVGVSFISANVADERIVRAVRDLFAFPKDKLPEHIPAQSRTEQVASWEPWDMNRGHGPRYFPVEWKDLTLASLACLYDRHLFVVTDMATEDTVYASGDGLRWFRGGYRVTSDATLAEIVTDSMRFPGYLRSRSIPGPLPGTTAQLADGGILDNHALSYFLLSRNRTDIDVVLSVIAENSPRRFTASHRITQLLAAIGLIHRHLSGLYAERILESDWSGRLIMIRLPSGLPAPTTLRRLGRDRTWALLEAGREATFTALGLTPDRETFEF